MKSLTEYIVESQSSNNTSTNKERKEELIRLLKGKGMKDYVNTLNKLLDDPKAKTLLEDGFGGELGDTKLSFNEASLSVTALTPSQNEIDIDSSINYGLLNPESVAVCFDNEVVINTPLITFKNEFIVDGHHRWSQVFAFNPKAKMKVYNYSSSEINATKMLKATQGAIAAVLAKKDNNEDLPQRVVKGNNVFKMTKSQIKNHIKAVLEGKKVALKEKYVEDGGKKFVETLSKFVNEVTDIDSAIKYLTNNLLELKTNNTPIMNAPQRGDMPQTSFGSPDGVKKHASPQSSGSALNKLKDDKFVGGAVS